MKKLYEKYKDFLIVFFYDAISKVCAAATSVFIIRMLSMNDYSDYTVFSSIAGVLASIIGSGISTAYLRMSAKRIANDRARDGSIYTFAIVIILLFTMLCFLFSNAFAYCYKVNIKIIIFGIFEAFVLSLNQLSTYVYQVRSNYSTSGKLNNIRNLSLAILLGVFFCITHTMSVNSVMITTIISGMLSATVLISLFTKKTNFQWEMPIIDRKEFMEIFFEIKWLVVYFLFLSLINSTDVIMLRMFTTEDCVANYGVAHKYYSLVLSLLPSISAVLRVRSSSKEYEESPQKRLMFVLKWIKKSTVLIIPVLFVLAIGAKILWHLLNGYNYDSSFYCFVIFLIGAGMSYIFAPCVNFVLSAGNHRKLCILAVIALIINVILNYVFIKKYGVIAVTITTVFSQAIINVGSAIIIVKKDRNGSHGE